MLPEIRYGGLVFVIISYPDRGRFILQKTIDKALVIIKETLIVTDNIRFEVSEAPRFIDQGSNWERVICPNCNAVIDISWWRHAMDVASESEFRSLAVIVPCCGTETYLNELKYEWPAGFARFSIEIWNPELDIAGSKLQELEIALGSSLIKIWAHY
jgi:hypothetical protein